MAIIVFLDWCRYES